MGATGGAGTAYHSGAPEFTPGFQWGSCYSIFSFFVYFVRLFVLFLLAIVLSVLPFTDSGYPFGIFKLFIQPRVHPLYSQSIKQSPSPEVAVKT
jgi:hypothetical protein